MTRRDLEKRLDALEEDVGDDEDDENDVSDTLAEAIKKVYWEKRDDDERERTTRERADRAVRDDDK